VVGSNAFLIARLHNDVIVGVETSPESLLRQQSVEITKSGDRDLSGAYGQCRTRDRIQHPGGNYYPRATLTLNKDNIGAAALLRVEKPDGPSMKSMPSIVDDHFLPDTGRITP